MVGIFLVKPDTVGTDIVFIFSFEVFFNFVYFILYFCVYSILYLFYFYVI